MAQCDAWYLLAIQVAMLFSFLDSGRLMGDRDLLDVYKYLNAIAHYRIILTQVRDTAAWRQRRASYWGRRILRDRKHPAGKAITRSEACP